MRKTYILNYRLTGHLSLKTLFSIVLMMLSLTVFAQQPGKIITGRVTDETDLPLSGASIKEPGTKNGVSTNAKGEFKITVKGQTLEVSFLGYKSQLVNITGDLMDIKLEPD